MSAPIIPFEKDFQANADSKDINGLTQANVLEGNVNKGRFVTSTAVGSEEFTHYPMRNVTADYPTDPAFFLDNSSGLLRIRLG